MNTRFSLIQLQFHTSFNQDTYILYNKLIEIGWALHNAIANDQ